MHGNATNTHKRPSTTLVKTVRTHRKRSIEVRTAFAHPLKTLRRLAQSRSCSCASTSPGRCKRPARLRNRPPNSERRSQVHAQASWARSFASRRSPKRETERKRGVSRSLNAPKTPPNAPGRGQFRTQSARGPLRALHGQHERSRGATQAKKRSQTRNERAAGPECPYDNIRKDT